MSADLAAELERTRSALDFLQRDQEPLERRYHAANAEADALRQLIGDIIDAVYPALRGMPLTHWSADEWQPRALRAIAHCRLAS